MSGQINTQEASEGLPELCEYVPALQVVHDPARGKLYVPAGHSTEVELVDPEGQAYPAEQFPLHPAELNPGEDPKVPLGHTVHGMLPPVL